MSESINTNQNDSSSKENKNMSEKSKKAFDFAQETTKQLLTLATGIIALTITFSKDIVGSLPSATKGFLAVGWAFYLLSILSGIWTLMAMTGTLEPKKKQHELPTSIRENNITVPSIIQVITFFLGIVFTVIFGIKSLCPIWPFC